MRIEKAGLYSLLSIFGSGNQYGIFLLAVLDTAAGVWLDRNGQVTSARGSKGQIDQDPSLELMRRCRHGAASVGIRIYVHGGLRGGNPDIFAFNTRCVCRKYTCFSSMVSRILA